MMNDTQMFVLLCCSHARLSHQWRMFISVKLENDPQTQTSSITALPETFQEFRAQLIFAIN